MHLLFLLLIVVISSCTCQKTIESKLPSQYAQRLEEQNRQLITKVESLEQKLLSKQDEIKKLLLSQHQKTREVVRTKAKLRSHSSKAETVANIAEVKTVLKAVADKEMTELLQEAAQESEQVIAMSIDALKREDVAKAFDLSNKAQQLIQPIRTFQGENGFKNGSDVVFIAPLTMKALMSCNVRTGPGVKNAVHFTLESGTQIKALTYSKNWIQIEDENLRKGWVYYKLLEFVQ
jgi:biopolymer transport protein ExbD